MEDWCEVASSLPERPLLGVVGDVVRRGVEEGAPFFDVDISFELINVLHIVGHDWALAKKEAATFEGKLKLIINLNLRQFAVTF